MSDHPNPPKVSIRQQIEAIQLACTRQVSIAGGQPVKSKAPRNQEEMHLRHLQAVTRTLVWLETHEEAVREFVEARRALRGTPGQGEQA